MSTKGEFIAALMAHVNQVPAQFLHEELPALIAKVYDAAFARGLLAANDPRVERYALSLDVDARALQRGLLELAAPSTTKH